MNQFETLKREMTDMIDNAANPIDIIYKIAERIEAEEGEVGFADHIKDRVRAVYGFALGEEKPLADEIKDTEARLKIIRKRRDGKDFSDEIKQRIDFAIEAHEEKIARLQQLLSDKAEGEA